MTGYSRYGNVSCYVDSKNESSYTNDNISTMAVNQATSGEYTFGDDSRLLDETPYYAAGNMKGLTITFEPKSGNNNHTKYEIKDAVVNKFINNGEQKLSNVSPLLYNRLKSVVSDIVEQDSQTYRNSEYTVFVRLGSAQKAVKIYGQYDGTNLPLRATPNTNVTIDRKPSESPDPIPPVDPNPGGGSGGGGGTVTPTPPHAHAYVDKIVSATCESKGYTEHVCDCGHSYQDKEVAALGHQWQQQGTPATCTTPGSTVQVCTRSGCGAKQGQASSPALGHDMKEVSRTESTCKVQGTVIKKCSRCTERNTENLPLASHKWATITTKAPTCTETGLKQDVCSVCKGTQNNVVIQAKGHQWVKKTETATCTMPGIVYDECSVCKMQQNRHASQALGHDYRETTRVESTCTTQGYIVRACSRQGCTESVTTKLDLLPHNYNHVVERAATCKQTGYEYDQCTMCSQKINEQTKPVLPHNMVEVGRIEPTCSKEGSITTQCSMCKAVNRTTLPKTQHTYETRVQNATCTVAGYEKQICRYCGYVASNRVINALGHDFNTGTRVDPTCTSAGNITKTCQRAGCGEKVVVETLSPIGHELRVISETQPTYDYPGSKVMKCYRPNCNYQATQSIPALKNQAAYAFFSSDDNSLNFVRAQSLNVGDRNNNKTVTNIYRVNESTPTGEPNTWALQFWANQSFLRAVDHVYYYDDMYPVNAGGWYADLKHSVQIHNPEKLHTEQSRSMNSMFLRCQAESIQTLISKLNTQNVESMTRMFEGMTQNIDVSVLKTNNVTDMSFMFAYSKEVTGLNSFDTTSVLTMEQMFDHTTATTLDLSSFVSKKDFQGVSRLNGLKMFNYAEKLRTIYATDNLTFEGSNQKDMFYNCRSIVGGNGQKYQNQSQLWARVDKPGQPGYFTDKNYKPSFTPVDGGKPYADDTHPCAVLCMDGTLYIERVNSNSEYMLGDLFTHTTSPSKIIGIANLDENIGYQGGSPLEMPVTLEGLQFYDQSTKDKVLKVKIIDEYRPTSAPYLFRDFKNCSSWDVRNLNTEMCNELYGMFKNCGSALPSSTNLVLELPGLKTKNDVNAHDMFAGSAFDRIYVDQGKLTEINTTQGQNMFKGCVNLIGGNGTRCDETKIHGDMAVVDKYNRPGYFSQLP